MSNTQGPFGALIWGTASGPVNFADNHNPPFRIASGDSTAVGYGDLVRFVSGASPTGYVTRWANGDGSAVNSVAGVFYGCRYYSTSQKKTVWNNYWPGSDATGDVVAFLCSDPNAWFTIQATSGPITQASLAQTSDVTMGSVNTTTGFSAMSLDAPSTTNPQYLPFKILSLVTSPPGANGTDAATAYNNVIVGFNNQIMKALLTIHS